MKELAIDTLNKTKVIISRDRKNRPMDNVLDESCNSRDEYDETCPFCRGNEKNIEEETFVINFAKNFGKTDIRGQISYIDYNLSTLKLYIKSAVEIKQKKQKLPIVLGVCFSLIIVTFLV